MKKLALIGALIAGLLSVTGLQAAEVVTLKGEGVCARCKLGGAKCGAVLAVKDGDEIKHYTVKGKGAMKIRGKASTVTGEVTEADGKFTIAATEIIIDKK